MAESLHTHWTDWLFIAVSAAQRDIVACYFHRPFLYWWSQGWPFWRGLRHNEI